MTIPQVFKQSLLVAVGAVALSGCTTIPKREMAASVAPIVTTTTATTPATGYDWTQILPPLPTPESAVDRADREAVRAFQAWQGSPRWEQAIRDDSLDFFQAFGDAMGPDFTAAKRPEIVALMSYARRNFGMANTETKTAFPRPRPFLADPNIKICVPSPPGGSSHPSGHSGLGWLTAQILARVEPARAQAILARGIAYGESRVVCGVHYPTDVQAGRLVADVMLARLDGDLEYQRLLAAAKAAVR